jgi:hypothetical protein
MQAFRFGYKLAQPLGRFLASLTVTVELLGQFGVSRRTVFLQDREVFVVGLVASDIGGFGRSTGPSDLGHGLLFDLRSGVGLPLADRLREHLAVAVASAVGGVQGRDLGDVRLEVAGLHLAVMRQCSVDHFASEALWDLEQGVGAWLLSHVRAPLLR